VLEVATKVDQYVDYAQFCRDLHDRDKGRRYRQLAGLHGPVPGEDDLCNFRDRIGDAVIDHIMAVAVDFLHHFGLIQGDLLSTDGQLESSYARYRGCTYACQDCQAFTLGEADRQALGAQLQSGAKRLELTCPFPEAVAKVREATAKKGPPQDPKVALLEIETVPADQTSPPQRQHVATLLGLPQDEVPPLRIKWCHLSQGPNGDLMGSCPKRPSDLAAKIGVHVDTKAPAKKEAVFGYVHLKTTDLNPELGLELPVGNSTYPANANEGTEFIPHRSKLAVPVQPGQVQLGDSANDIIANYEWLHDRGAIAVFAYNRRNEHVDAPSLVNRGYDINGTPYAPCGRLCHSNGYDYETQSRQYVCGLPCPAEEQRRCPHRSGVLGYCHRMRFKDHPRLIGPIQRGSKAWHDLYGARSSSERTNSYDQEVVGKAHPLRMRGLKAFRFAGAMRTLAQLLRRALNFVLDVTYTLGKAPVAQT
jgi:cytochrome c1